MCGIFGMVKKKNFIDDQSNNYYNYMIPEEKAFIKNLLIVSSLRGTDSTGIAAIDNTKKSVELYKAPVNALSFLHLSDFDLSMEDILSPDVGYIGHVRAATIGGISMKSSHPFHFGDIVGVHNGTLNTWRYLDNNAISDSEAIFSGMSRCENYLDFLSDLIGAYALAWYDREVGMYYFARNDARPLVIKQTEEALLFASEMTFVDFALHRAGGGQKFTDNFQKKVKTEGSLKPYHLYEFDPIKMEFSGIYSYTQKHNNHWNNNKNSNNKYYKQKKFFPKNGNTQKDTTKTYQQTSGNVLNLTKDFERKQIEKASPFEVDGLMDLIPLHYTVYNQSQEDGDYGTLSGYINNQDRNYYWVSYWVKDPKNVLESYYESWPDYESILSGKIDSIEEAKNINQVKGWRDIITDVAIYPELIKDGTRLLSHVIDGKSLKLDMVTEDDI